MFEGEYSDDEMGDYQLCFKCDVDVFDGLQIGKGLGAYGGMYLTISPDKLSIYNSKDDSLVSEHDLSMLICDYISVNIVADLRNHATIEISSSGGSEKIDTYWAGRQGTLFVIAGDNAKYKNCRLSYYCNGWNKPIWLFGDSYFNCTADARWTSYLTKNGYERYPGRGSNEALDSLKIMLNYAAPKEIIWCMGMNDGDTEEINPNWLKDVEEVKMICKEKNINLILATIPNCPTVNNSYKNNYIEESGYKYIDFAKAVGARYDTNWNNGMLEDGDAPCHPTITGALTLYNEAIVTCPELL